MNWHRFVTRAASVGIAIPVAWLAIYWGLLRGNPDLIHAVMSAGYFDRVLLAVWPSWILLAADPEERSVAIPAISVLVNALLYACLGWLTWFGLYRKRAALGLAAAVVGVGWYFLFTWY